MPDYYIKLRLLGNDDYYWFSGTGTEITEDESERWFAYGMDVGTIVGELIKMYQPFSIELIVR